MDIDPGEVLSEARDAYAKKNYSLALEKYQWFYQNAIEIQESYYGVRLSYCLDEWAQLGDEYPEAKGALTKLKTTTLSEFKKTNSRRLFHEYSSISEYLKCKSEVLDEFLMIDSTNQEQASKLFSFVYEYCASNEMWDLCAKYLGNGYKQYQRTLEMFDHMIKYSKKASSEQGEAIYLDGINSTKRELLWLLNMLHHIKADQALESAINKMKFDLEERGFSELAKEISGLIRSKPAIS